MAQWKPGSSGKARGTTATPKGTSATPKGTNAANHKSNMKTPGTKPHSGPCMMSMGKRDKYC